MKVAFEVFRNQRYGNIISVAGALGKSAVPLQSINTAAKHGILGFASTLREEVMIRPYKDIDVSVLLPASFDTPLYTHAKSHLGRQPKPIPPVYDPQLMADALVDCAMNPRPEITVGTSATAMVLASRMMPLLMERYMSMTGINSQLADKPKPEEGNDNLFKPMPGEYGIRGGFGTTGEHLTRYARQHPLRVAVAAALPLFFLYTFFGRQKAALLT
jgi:hypothetical protein